MRTTIATSSLIALGLALGTAGAGADTLTPGQAYHYNAHSSHNRESVGVGTECGQLAPPSSPRRAAGAVPAQSAPSA